MVVSDEAARRLHSAFAQPPEPCGLSLATPARAAPSMAVPHPRSLRKHSGTRALVGPVGGGTPYFVGERGPELFVPGGSGRIGTPVAVRRLMEARSGAAAPATNVRHGDIHFAQTVRSNSGDAQEIVRLARLAFRAEMQQMQRGQRGYLSD